MIAQAIAAIERETRDMPMPARHAAIAHTLRVLTATHGRGAVRAAVALFPAAGTRRLLVGAL